MIMTKRLCCNNLVHSMIIPFSIGRYCDQCRVSHSTKFLKNCLQIRCIAESTLFRHVRLYVVPHVLMTWQQQQSSMLNAVRCSGRKLRLMGDGRSDSPGHCAKFGTYTLLDGDTGKVLATELVQV